MFFEFYLDDIEIEEPIGFSEIVLNMKRDDNWHGIFFEASTSDLEFYGDAAEYLIRKKENEGLQANVTFKAYQSCGIYDTPELIFEGKLDFRKYSADCGSTCSVTIPVEQTGCTMTFRNRYDQKVDMDSTTTFDKITPLQYYSKLNFEMEIPAKELEAGVDGKVDGSNSFEVEVTSIGSGYRIFTRPSYVTERDNSIATGQLVPVSQWETNGSSFFDSPLTPQLLYEDDIRCFSGDFEYDIRMKGNFNRTDGDAAVVEIKVMLITWDGTGNIFDNHVVIDEVTLYDNPGTPLSSGNFDGTLSGSTPLTDGVGLYAITSFGALSTLSVTSKIDITFDSDTFFTLTAAKLCPSTHANVYMVNEALSRAVEAVTDGCLKVRSDYYGRTDSQPYASTEDGCGSLRILTSGLKIRRAENARWFVSPKDLFDGLRPIDNIGMGIEPNPSLPNADQLRIEPIDYFYKDEEIFRCPYAEVKTITQEQNYYSVIKIGYKKWEVENINGLDEFNSNREYRTSLSTVNNTLDLTSALVAGGYAWEVTRQQSFAETGKADTKFDNDTFIACVERDGYGFKIEQGNIDNPTNIFSPATAYNWRIRPFSNLMRWFKSVANSYTNFVNTTNKLFFSQGTGNFLASGEIGGAYPACKLENGPKAENKDLAWTDFIDIKDATPLWKPDNLTFRYPLSVKEYRELKAKPYGYISVQCGSGEWKKGYIQEVRYRLNKGEADFVLKQKWEQ